MQLYEQCLISSPERHRVQRRYLQVRYRVPVGISFQASSGTDAAPLLWRADCLLCDSTSRQFTFATRIYHPGVNESGKICVAELRDDMVSCCTYLIWRVQQLTQPRSGSRLILCVRVECNAMLIKRWDRLTDVHRARSTHHDPDEAELPEAG